MLKFYHPLNLLIKIKANIPLQRGPKLTGVPFAVQTFSDIHDIGKY